MKEVLILRGAYAGKVLTMEDDVAASAVADGWGRDRAEAPAEGEAEVEEELAEAQTGELPQSLKDFEDAIGRGGTSTDMASASDPGEPKNPPPLSQNPPQSQPRSGADQTNTTQSQPVSGADESEDE